MECVDLTWHSLIQVMRLLSLKRRSGRLVIEDAHDELSIEFAEGRIIGADSKRKPCYQFISNKLRDAGVLSRELEAAVSGVKLSTQKLEEFLVKQGHITETQFEQALKAHQLELLYELRNPDGKAFHFKTLQISNDSPVPLSYPGQLLVDLVSYDNDLDRFQLTFGSTKQLQLQKELDHPSKLSKAESVVWKNIDEATSLEHLYKLCLLSSYEFRSAILSLLDRRMIGIAGHENLAGCFLDTIDLDNQTVDGSEPLAESDDKIIDTAATLLHAINVQSEFTDPAIDQAEVLLNSTDSPSAAREEHVQQPEVVRSASREEIERQKTNRSVKHRLLSLNYSLLQQQATKDTALLVILPFAVASAVVLPQFMTNLFRAIEAFYILP